MIAEPEPQPAVEFPQEPATPCVVDMAEAEMAKALEEFKKEFGPEKMDRELRQIQEDVECWWADRNGGDG